MEIFLLEKSMARALQRQKVRDHRSHVQAIDTLKLYFITDWRSVVDKSRKLYRTPLIFNPESCESSAPTHRSGNHSEHVAQFGFRVKTKTEKSGCSSISSINFHSFVSRSSLDLWLRDTAHKLEHYAHMKSLCRFSEPFTCFDLAKSSTVVVASSHEKPSRSY